MNKKILIINAGSSSIKFRIYQYNNLKEIASGLCERINIDGFIKIKSKNSEISKKVNMPNHYIATKILLDMLKKIKIITNFNEFVGIGHRIAMGGSIFKKSILINKKNLKQIVEYGKIAPLHNICESNVINVFEKLLPSTKNVAIFDTSFHTTIPDVNSDYCLDRKTTKKYSIKKYGYHGTSYRYINQKMEKILKRKNLNLVVCHIGNGASICAIKNGKSYDTSMGLSPLQGLIMGTRCGDIDGTVAIYLANQGFSANEISNELNKKSGFLGIVGVSDSRDVIAKANKGNKNAILARQIQLQRIANYIVTYVNEIGKTDAIVFTAGCGENDPELIEGICQKINLFKLKCNSKINHKKYDDYIEVSDRKSFIKIFKVRTNEEIMMAYDVKNIVK